jgi:hypothetical protein
VFEKIRIWILVLKITDCEKFPIASITTSRFILPVCIQILDASQKKYLGKLCGLVLAGGSGAGKTTLCRYIFS